jgi:hypothetical protein
MKITSMDSATARMLEDEVMKALKPIMESYGINIRPAGGRYSSLQYTMKLEMKVKETAAGVSGDQAEFNRSCFLYGCKPEHYKKVFESAGEKFMITGFAPRRPKFPVLGIRIMDGRRFKFPESVLRSLVANNQ